MKNLILLTGATGFLGPHVLELLLENGYQIRVAGPDPVRESEKVSWVNINFLQNINYDDLVHGVSIIIHLAAELNNEMDMECINVDATNKLALAAERHGVKLFIYTSSVGVYGFPGQREISELTPTLSLNDHKKNIFLAERFLYIYSLTKLKGEVAIKGALKKTSGVIFRPSNMVDEEKIKEILSYGFCKRIWRGGRRTHHIYVKDVAAAILYAVQALGVNNSKLIGFDVYNLTNDTGPDKTYANLFKAYCRHSGDASKGCPFTIHPIFELIKDAIKFRVITRSLPAGLVDYSPSKLLKSGFRYKYGIDKIYENIFKNQGQELDKD